MPPSTEQLIPNHKPNYVDQAIGERVNWRRSILGIASQDLARELSVTVDVLSNLERGDGRFSAEQLRALSVLLEVKPSFFFETMSAPHQEQEIEETDRPNWLATVLGKEDAPKAPGLRTDRIKEMLRRAVLFPGSLAPLEVQELAASVLIHLVSERK